MNSVYVAEVVNYAHTSVRLQCKFFKLSFYHLFKEGPERELSQVYRIFKGFKTEPQVEKNMEN